MNKISIYNRALGVSPSGYYRITQYLSSLQSKNKIKNIAPVNFYSWYISIKGNKYINILLSPILYVTMLTRLTFFLLYDLIIFKPDYIIISRGLLPRILPFWIKKIISNIKSSLFWDFDDDITLSKEISESEFDLLCNISSKIIVTHNYLKNKIPNNFRKKVHILPTTDGDFERLDFSKIIQVRYTSFKSEINIVWTGTAGNLINVRRVLPCLDYAAEKIMKSQNKRVILNILCNKLLDDHTNFLIIKNIKWSQQSAIKQISSSHIGIMPLDNNEYALGKGGFKLIQYMAASLPIIGSEVGYNSEIIDDSNGILIKNNEDEKEWLEALEYIISNWQDYIYFSQNSRKKWNQKFSFLSNLKFWAKILNLEIKEELKDYYKL